MKLIQYKANEKRLNQLDELVKLLGIDGYGKYQTAIEFSITRVLLQLKKDTEQIPSLEPDKLELWLHSVQLLKFGKLPLPKQAKCSKKQQK